MEAIAALHACATSRGHPQSPARIQPQLQAPDHIHLNPKGYEAIANSIPLNVLDDRLPKGGLGTASGEDGSSLANADGAPSWSDFLTDQRDGIVIEMAGTLPLCPRLLRGGVVIVLGATMIRLPGLVAGGGSTPNAALPFVPGMTIVGASAGGAVRAVGGAPGRTGSRRGITRSVSSG